MCFFSSSQSRPTSPSLTNTVDEPKSNRDFTASLDFRTHAEPWIAPLAIKALSNQKWMQLCRQKGISILSTCRHFMTEICVCCWPLAWWKACLCDSPDMRSLLKKQKQKKNMVISTFSLEGDQGYVQAMTTLAAELKWHPNALKSQTQETVTAANPVGRFYPSYGFCWSCDFPSCLI